MKKKIFGGVFILALVAVATFNVNFNKTEVSCDFGLANVEALAVEAPSDATPIDCYSTMTSTTSNPYTEETYCGDCKAHNAREWSSKTTCIKTR